MEYEESMRELSLFGLQKTRLQEYLFFFFFCAVYKYFVFKYFMFERGTEKKTARLFQISTVEAQEANDSSCITGEFDCIRNNSAGR